MFDPSLIGQHANSSISHTPLVYQEIQAHRWAVHASILWYASYILDVYHTFFAIHALQPPHSKISNFSVSHIICSNATYVYQTDHAVTSFSSLISRVIRSSKCSFTRACTLLVVLKYKWANFNRQTQCYALCWAINECLIFLTPVCDNQSFGSTMTIIYELEKSQSPPSLSSLWVLIKSPNIPISTTVQSHRCSSILLYCGWYVKSYVIVNGGKENQCEHIWFLCFIMISSAIF